MAVSQGRLGKVSIGGTLYPVFDWAMGSPRNIQQGMPVGNTWATAKGEGLQSTRFTARFMARLSATEVLSTTFWNYWLARTFGGGFDDTAGQTIIAVSGRNTYTLANAKAEALVLTVQKGSIVGITGTFLAPGKPSRAADTAASSYLYTVDNTGLMMFDRATFGGFSGSVYGATVTYSNNHAPNAPLDGTKVLSAWEAGGIACSANFTFAEWTTGSQPFADDSTLTISLTNGTTTRVLSLTKCTANNPDDLNVNPGQVYQPFDTIVQGSAAAAPLVVS